MYNSLHKRLYSKLKNLYLKRYVISNPSASDVYIVSFPKSGNTWLSFLIANVNQLIINSHLNVTWYNLHNIIPDIHISKSAVNQAEQQSGTLFHNFIKFISNYHFNIIKLYSR